MDLKVGTIDMSSFENTQAYYCPITCELMVDPVIDPDGNSYERSAITEWLTKTGMSPITRNAMNVSDLVTNRALKDAIDSERGNLSSTSTTRAPLDVSWNFVHCRLEKYRHFSLTLPHFS